MNEDLLQKPVPKAMKVFSDSQVSQMITKSIQAEKQQTKESTYSKITTYCSVPILKSHSLRSKARSIIIHNQHNDVSRITLMGKTGSGKSTLVTNLAHEIHTLAKSEFNINYIVRWFHRKDLNNFEKLIRSTPHVNQIWVFDDMSYSTELMGSKEKKSLKATMTEARHIAGEIKLIFVFNIHYTKALDKMLRDADFKAYTSISDEELKNFYEIMGQHNPAIGKFKARYQSMLLKGWWNVKLLPDSDLEYIYTINKPFRLALFSELGILHFVVYASYKSAGSKVACNLCAEYPLGKPIAPQALIDSFKKTYGDSRAKTILRYALFYRGFKSINSEIERGINSVWATLRSNATDEEALAQLVKDEVVHGSKRVYQKKEEKEALSRQIQDHAETKKIQKKIIPRDIESAMNRLFP